MKKYIITFCMALVAIAGSFTAAAQEALTVLQLHLTDGTTDKYLLAEFREVQIVVPLAMMKCIHPI